MPTYSFICTACGNQFESIQKIDNRNNPCKAPCAKCNASKIEMRINGAAQFIYNSGTNFKVPDAFNEKLKAISKNNPRNKMEF